ncbi:hypothetical protein [Rhodoferax sp.]|uniref:hypothetical protein n=1 Tax=Rhodoferax sp. TaxID=50421 RepID=UPI0028404B15|nr:hypothetical protein [Rhodoferax sp.]MDR3370681.1 hypothetical protein [Rhodoferax sp.]
MADSSDAAVLLAIKGVIFDLPASDQEMVKQCAEQIGAIVDAAGVCGQLALALVGALAASEG